MHDAISLLAGWDSFYVVIGSASAALTGLMFVVVTLIPDAGVPASEDALSAFGTPTVMHFCGVLMVSAVALAPWTHMAQVGVAIGLTGVAGLVYGAVVFARSRRQQDYKPVLEDWIWHTLLPAVAYAVLMAAAVVLTWTPIFALFAIGTSAALLLFIGIHNAWDTVVFLALSRVNKQKPE